MTQRTFELDETDWALLGLLQTNARITLAAAGRALGLTAPALAERMRRLEDAGVILGYRAALDLGRLGRPIVSFIRVRYAGGNYAAFKRLVEQSTEIVECHHITGEDCFIVKAAVASMPDLEKLTAKLSEFGPSTTSIVYSTVLQHRIITSSDNEVRDRRVSG